MPKVGRFPWRCYDCDEYPVYAVLSNDEVRIRCGCAGYPLLQMNVSALRQVTEFPAREVCAETV